MSQVNTERDAPRAVVHKRILDEAESRPEASFEDLAASVSVASADLVERVLEEYGDPGTPASSTNAEEQSMSETSPTGDSHKNGEEEPFPTPDDLTEKQYQTLAAVYHEPEASQGTIARQLDVTRATISRRLNDIPGFKWTDRDEFARTVFVEAEPPEPTSPAAATNADSDAPPDPQNGSETDTEAPNAAPENAGSAISDELSTADVEHSPTSASATTPPSGAGADNEFDEGAEDVQTVADSQESLPQRVSTLEQKLENDLNSASAEWPPELAHKVAHACLDSEAITREEELRVMKLLME